MAPRTRSQSGPALRRALGTAMHLAPERYWPVRVRDRLERRPGVHDGAALLAGAGAELEHEVGLAHGGQVVLHHQHGVAEVAEPVQQREQPVGVPRVEADGGLVEHVHRVHQLRAEGVGQGDALGLAAREGARLPVEGEVPEPDVVEVAEPGVELVEDQLRHLLPRRAQRQAPQPAAQLADRAGADVRDGVAAHAHRQRVLVESGALAVGAGERQLVLPQEDADVLLVALRLEAAEERDDAEEAS